MVSHAVKEGLGSLRAYDRDEGKGMAGDQVRFPCSLAESSRMNRKPLKRM